LGEQHTPELNWSKNEEIQTLGERHLPELNWGKNEIQDLERMVRV